MDGFGEIFRPWKLNKILQHNHSNKYKSKLSGLNFRTSSLFWKFEVSWKVLKTIISLLSGKIARPQKFNMIFV